MNGAGRAIAAALPALAQGVKSTLDRRRRAWRFLVALSVMAVAPCAIPSAPLAQRLADAGFTWMPQLSPSGPLVIVISLPAQHAYVYRNGVRIAESNVSTGRAGFETPPGVYSILQKAREHFSNRYDNAPMPFMQRLSWDGVALHAGQVPGYPASHGCIRLPYAFAEKLFRLTSQGVTVVVADERVGGPAVAYPGFFAPVESLSGAPRVLDGPARQGFSWTPERATNGPLTIVLSTHDREIVVMRNAVEIGRAAVSVNDPSLRGTQVYVLLEGAGPGMSQLVPGRRALRWMSVPMDRDRPDHDRPVAAPDPTLSGQLSMPDEFAGDVYTALVPGATVVVTDAALQAEAMHANEPLLQADEPLAPWNPKQP